MHRKQSIIVYLLLFIISVLHISCKPVSLGVKFGPSASFPPIDPSLNKPQKVVYFLSIEGGYDIYHDCKNIYEADSNSYFTDESVIHFVPIFIPRSLMISMKEESLSLLCDKFIEGVLEDVETRRDRSRDSFYFCGYRLGALAVLEAVMRLHRDLNIKKVALISPPLHGYEALKDNQYPYQDPRGPITLIMKSRGQKVQTSSTFKQLLPDSEYLATLRSFLQELDNTNIQVYLASASVKNLCNVSSIPSEVRKEVENLFRNVSYDLRKSYDARVAPDLTILKPLTQYLENASREQFYAFIQYMYDGDDHDGFYSMHSQEASEIWSNNIVRARFDGYSGGGHIALLSYMRADFEKLFDPKEDTLANESLQKSIVEYLLKDSNPKSIVADRNSSSVLNFSFLEPLLRAALPYYKKNGDLKEDYL